MSKIEEPVCGACRKDPGRFGFIYESFYMRLYRIVMLVVTAKYRCKLFWAVWWITGRVSKSCIIHCSLIVRADWVVLPKDVTATTTEWNIPFVLPYLYFICKSLTSSTRWVAKYLAVPYKQYLYAFSAQRILSCAKCKLKYIDLVKLWIVECQDILQEV